MPAATKTHFERRQILPEGPLDGRGWLSNGRALSKAVRLEPSAWLRMQSVSSELEFKQRTMAEGRIAFHAQIGYRSLDESCRAWESVYTQLAEHDCAPDRYGICLDWSMGYPVAERSGRPRGTGLIMSSVEDFARLANMAPVAPHFGDFVLGMPSAVENVSAALLAGATSIGNLAQYFTFRLPGWPDDIITTQATVQALGLIAAQPVPILVHSNLDDGYAAWFEDMSSTIGFAMVERWIVEDLIGGSLSHCYGHTFSDPVKRMAFQLALAEASPTPGTMIYGNTTLYSPNLAKNWGALASYIVVDAFSLRYRHTGHAVTPIPVTEAQRIPTPEEIVEAHLAARRVVERMDDLSPLMQPDRAEELAQQLLRGGRRFYDRLREGLEEAGFDTTDPAEVMLALRRIGPISLEAKFGEVVEQGKAVTSPFVPEIDRLAERILKNVPAADVAVLRDSHINVIVATTDVHFYGKRLLDIVLSKIGISVIDGGISVDPDVLADIVSNHSNTAIAISTYNGVALSFAQRLKGELARRRISSPIYFGGRLNEIMEDTSSSLPVDVSNEIRQLGMTTCGTVEELIASLSRFVQSGEKLAP